MTLSGACEPAHADSPGKRAPMGLPRHHSTNNISIIHNIKATTDSVAGSLLPSFIRLYWAPQQTRVGGGTAKNSTPGGQACGSGRTETRSLHCDLLLDPLVAFSGLCLALV